MCIKNRIIAILYRVVALAFGILALLLDFGIFDGCFQISKFLYFTILSNMLCVGLFLCLVVKTAKEISLSGVIGTTSINRVFKGEVMISIILTMVVYHFILIPNALEVNPYSSLNVSDVILHYVMPFFTIFDWVLFDEKGFFKVCDPIFWMIGPLVYLEFVFIQSKFDFLYRVEANINQYIYAFLDISILGTFRSCRKYIVDFNDFYDDKLFYCRNRQNKSIKKMKPRIEYVV